VREAEARVTEERGSLLPHVDVDAQHGGRTFNTASFGIDFPSAPGEPALFDPNGEVLGPVTTIDFRGHLAQTLFDWSALQRVRGARASVTASEAHVEAAKQRAAAEAALAYVRAERATSRLAARTEDVALAEDLLGIAREMLGSGVGVRLDVTRAESQLASMQAQLLAARSEAERSLLGLRHMLRLPLDAAIALEDTLAPLVSEGAADVDSAIARRPDVVEFGERISAARLDASAVRAERLPTLSIVAGDGITGSSYDHLLNTWEWSLQVSVPVFDGLRRGAREEQERARMSALEANRRELVERVAFDIRDSELQVDAARQQVEVGRIRLQLAEEELTEARDRFSAGVSGSADVFTASLRLNEARTAEVDARASLQLARVALAAAQGVVTEIR
jgi:outer membrane protein